MKLANCEADKFASMEMGDEYFGPAGKALREYNIRLAKDLATSFKGTDIDTLDASAHHFNRNRS